MPVSRLPASKLHLSQSDICNNTSKSDFVVSSNPGVSAITKVEFPCSTSYFCMSVVSADSSGQVFQLQVRCIPECSVYPTTMSSLPVIPLMNDDFPEPVPPITAIILLSEMLTFLPVETEVVAFTVSAVVCNCVTVASGSLRSKSDLDLRTCGLNPATFSPDNGLKEL